ncbi:hypothetical protein EV368DRAFT_89229 [Lentinula lateritia]|nr:hypothetical protein EV368DRAFT_89229 [Lentinula lateritia]
MPEGGVPLAAFPLDCYDLLVALPDGALSSLPRTALAVAIGWNKVLLRKLALEHARSVILFEEGDRESGSRMVVYFGGNRFATPLEALGFLFENWQVEPSWDDRDEDQFGVQILRGNLRWEYSQGRDHEVGIRRGWDWLGNV